MKNVHFTFVIFVVSTTTRTYSSEYYDDMGTNFSLIFSTFFFVFNDVKLTADVRRKYKNPEMVFEKFFNFRSRYIY